MITTRLLALFTLAAVLAPAVHAAPKETVSPRGSLWTRKADRELKWFRVTAAGTVLAADDAALYSLDPATGEVRWRREDLKKIEEHQASEIAGTPLLLVNENSGRFQPKTRLNALDILTGETIWSTDRIKGATAGVFPIYEKDLVLLATTPTGGAKDKPDLLALDMASGEARWEVEFPEKVDLHVVEASGKYFPKFDLSGYQEPVVVGDDAYVTWAGLHRIDLRSGAVTWGVRYDVTEGAIKRGNAAPVVAGETVFTSAKGQIRAIDAATGAVRWTSKDFGNAVAEMVLADGVLYGRLGGTFYDSGSRTWQLKKPLGVVAVDPGTGAAIWKYEGAKDSLANMLLLPEQNVVLLADAENLIGLDTNRTGKVKESFKVKLEFKNKLGAAATAAKIAKIGLGGIRGLMSKGPESRDFPVALVRREDGVVVVRGRQHVLAFEPSKREILWSVAYNPPGVSGWELWAMTALTAFTYAMQHAQAASTYYGTSENRWANQQRLKTLQRYHEYAGKRFSATRSSERYVYVLTTVQEGEEKGAGIVGIDMATGRGDRQLLLGDKKPEYQVDEYSGRLFYLKDDRELTAYAIAPQQ